MQITADIFNNGYIIFFMKSAVLILLVLYAIFALIIVRQVDLMGQTLKTNIAGIIKIFALFHAFFALGLIFLALIIL